MFTEGLVKFVHETNYEDIPEEAKKVARLAIRDYIAVAMAGSQDKSGMIMSEMVKEAGAPPEATVIGGRYKSSTTLAALSNGTSAHTQDYDDCLDFPGAGLAHPTAGTFSGILTVGEKLHMSGKDLLTAYCLGVEAYGKIGLFLIKTGGAGSRGWEWTGTLGIIGGTIGLSKMLGFTEEQMINALGTASTMAGSLIRNFGSMAGHLHGGNGARCAIEAVTLVQKGYDCTGNDVIEGHGGYYNAFADRPDQPISEADQKAMLAKLGNPWNLVEPSLMFKYYPCAHISHFGAWAGQEIYNKYHIDWRDIDAIEFRQPPALFREASHPEPLTGVQGRFNMGYCLCRALMNGTIKFEFFTDDTVKDPDTISLYRKLTYGTTGDYENDGPFARQEVYVRLKDGTEINHEVDHPKGEPQNPQTPEELEEKYMKCAAFAGYQEPAVSKIKDMVADFENIKDINELTELLGK